MPKITLCDLNPDQYCATSQNNLKVDILSKNPKIKELVDNGKTFEEQKEGKGKDG